MYATSLCVSQVGPYDLVACWRDSTPIKGLTSAFKALIGERKARASLTENGVTTPLFTVYLVFESSSGGAWTICAKDSIPNDVLGNAGLECVVYGFD